MTAHGQSQQVYIDGKLVAVNNIPPRYGVSYPVFIGVISQDGLNSAGKNYYHGAIDDVRIYSRVLSIAEIESLFNLD